MNHIAKSMAVINCMVGTAWFSASMQTLFAEYNPWIRDYTVWKWFYIVFPILVAYSSVGCLLRISDDKKREVLIDGLKAMMKHDPGFSESVIQYLRRTEK